MNFLRFLTIFLLAFAGFWLWIRWRTRFVRKGLNQLLENDFDGAIATFERILETEQPQLNNYINLSVAYMGADRHSEALDVMDDAIVAGAIVPPEEIESADFLEATYLSNRGVVLGKLKRFEEAADCLETSLRNTPIENPFYTFRLLNYARIYAEHDQRQAAVRVLDEIDRWFETHEMTDPRQIEIFEKDMKQVRALVDG